MSGQLHVLAALTPEKKPPVMHFIGSWVDPRADLDDVEKRKFLTQPGLSDLSVVQAVASRYTDYAIPAPFESMVNINHSKE
jgi:hypothetical protein